MPHAAIGRSAAFGKSWACGGIGRRRHYSATVECASAYERSALGAGSGLGAGIARRSPPINPVVSATGMPGGEQFHIDGQDGVELAKRWLEATGRFRVQWHSGDKVAVPYLAVDQLDRPKEGFDIRAMHLDSDLSPRVEIFAEVKNYNGAYDQAEHYAKFLTDCASAVMFWEDHPPAQPTEFMWITWHPFGATDKYLRHVKAEAVKKRVSRSSKSRVLRRRRLSRSRRPSDRRPCNEVARRLWFIIAPRRLEEMLSDQTRTPRA